eukprot:scaffold69229_cov34-Tisochrysis_lutea.AAC.3
MLVIFVRGKEGCPSFVGDHSSRSVARVTTEHTHTGGVGGFGRVYAAQWRGQNVAVKVLTCDDAKHYQALLKEVQLCARFRACPYIVRLLGACMGPRCKRTPSKASTAASTAGTAAPPAVLHSVRKSSTAHHTYSSTDTGTGIMLEAGTDVKPGGGADIGSAVQQPESRAEQTGAGCSSKDGLSHSGASHAGTPPHLGTAQAGFVGPPLSPQLEVNRSLFATGAMASTEGVPEDSLVAPCLSVFGLVDPTTACFREPLIQTPLGSFLAAL